MFLITVINTDSGYKGQYHEGCPPRGRDVNGPCECIVRRRSGPSLKKQVFERVGRPDHGGPFISQRLLSFCQNSRFSL
uniref:Thyroglobulin type-1 domain-containing protein n=1 Tax=Steinernema glaseri TaxID=37863 RepID=A0A1I7ZM98_9BILA